MKHMGQDIVNISREFLDAAGADRYQDVKITLPDFEKNHGVMVFKLYKKPTSSRLFLPLETSPSDCHRNQ